MTSALGTNKVCLFRTLSDDAALTSPRTTIPATLPASSASEVTARTPYLLPTFSSTFIQRSGIQPHFRYRQAFLFAYISMTSHSSAGSSDLWGRYELLYRLLRRTTLQPFKIIKNGSFVLSITYGSGQVAGFISEDTMTFSGFNMNQEFRAYIAFITPPGSHPRFYSPSQPLRLACSTTSCLASWVLGSHP